MVARITFPKAVEAALNYNEQKAQKANAVCLFANGYLKEAREMNFYEKLQGFTRLATLNERATTKTLHVSLNFDPSERLSDSRLTELANVYMDKIGFGDQPFLVYKHEDAGHPHIHIVSTTIRCDGTRINTHNLGRNQSEKARKELEQQFHLVKAERNRKSASGGLTAAIPEKATYGKHETKGAISNIVTAVFNQYKFSSLPEYNAALRQFNVVADRGKVEGRIHRNRGLVYRILNGNGIRVGVPIKASSIHCQPTLKNLEQKFLHNPGGKEPMKARVKAAVDDGLTKASSIAAFVAVMQERNIYALLRQNESGVVYGITYVDNQSGCVFNGSDLGKGYSAGAVQSRLAAAQSEPVFELAAKKQSRSSSAGQSEKISHQPTQKEAPTTGITTAVLDALLSTKEGHENVPASLLNKKRKKKRRKNNI